MHIERLSRLADLLESYRTPPGSPEFNMTVFYEEWNCGSAACACGLAALDPWFNAQGFTLTAGGSMMDAKQLLPIYLGYLGFDAIKHFFRLDYLEMTHLFALAGYYQYRRPKREVTKEIVAARIREFIAAKGLISQCTPNV